jgi:hypothetical protein
MRRACSYRGENSGPGKDRYGELDTQNRYWKPRQLVPLRLELLSNNVSSATSQSGSWKNYE